MREKTFLEILTERIEQRLKTDISASENLHFPSENKSQNAKNGTFSSEKQVSSTPHPVENLWKSGVFPRKTVFFTSGQAQKKDLINKVYPTMSRPRPTEKRVSHALTEEQNQAWNYFFRWKSGLALDFTEKELKSVFRKLAQRLHPDRTGGSSTHYQELKKNFDLLVQVFK